MSFFGPPVRLLHSLIPSLCLEFWWRFRTPVVSLFLFSPFKIYICEGRREPGVDPRTSPPASFWPPLTFHIDFVFFDFLSCFLGIWVFPTSTL